MRKLINEYLLTIISYFCVLIGILIALSFLKSDTFFIDIMKGVYGL